MDLNGPEIGSTPFDDKQWQEIGANAKGLSQKEWKVFGMLSFMPVKNLFLNTKNISDQYKYEMTHLICVLIES